jgi:hypothetical protein
MESPGSGSSIKRREVVSNATLEPMVIGDRVYWSGDDEGGTGLATGQSITIRWDESGVEVYSWSPRAH